MISSMTDACTFLSIAGYTIKIHFHASLILNGKRSPAEVSASMLEHNEGFILKKTPATYDFLIQFVEQGSHIYHKNGKGVTVDVFREVTKRKIIANTHISRSHFVYLLRYVINKLIAHDGFVLHSSANLIGGKASIYFGPSGAGKSTIVSLLQGTFPILSDDECYIKREGDTFFYYQGPFLEKKYNYDKTYKKYHIANLFILHKSKQCVIHKNDTVDRTIARLSRQIWIGNKEHTAEALRNLTRLAAHIPCADLYFPKDANLLRRCISLHFKVR